MKLDSFKSLSRLKAQQTPVSVITGLKISEQLTSFPSHLHCLNMCVEEESSEEGNG